MLEHVEFYLIYRNVFISINVFLSENGLQEIYVHFPRHSSSDCLLLDLGRLDSNPETFLITTASTVSISHGFGELYYIYKINTVLT